LQVKLWRPLTVLAAFFPADAKRVVAARARRWSKVAREDSRLVEDLIDMGGILTGQPAMLENGWPTPALPDAKDRDYQLGRRDMALQLLALMNLTPTQLHSLVKEDAYGPDDHD
jgi:hypothetical protein